MSGFVLDASAALPWCFEDEATPHSWDLLDRLDREKAVVPAIWPLEIANILVAAERRRRIALPEITRFVSELALLDIEVAHETSGRALTDILTFARTHKLTAYDAAYLDLALDRTLPLATRDRAMAEAAKRAGVEVIPA